jgi:heat shock protein HslJ
MIKKNTLLTFVLFVFVALNAQERTKKVIYIAGEKMRCEMGNIITSCYKMKPHEDSAWRAFSYEIEGFIWQSGMQQCLQVEELKENNVTSYRMMTLIESIPTVLNQTEILENNQWELIGITVFHNYMPYVPRAKANIQFNLDSNYATGYAGCNTFLVKASYSNGRINFKDYESTLRSCQNDSIEKLVYNVLSGESEFYHKGKILYIGNSKGVLLSFRPKRKIDSLIYTLSHPKPYKGNSFQFIEGITYDVTLDDLEEFKGNSFLFVKNELTTDETQKFHLKLDNIDKNNQLVSIHVLKRDGNTSDGIYKAELIFKDGRKKTINLRNVR